MKSIKYQLLGIALLLFAASPYIIGLTTDSSTYFFAGLFIQLVGIILVFIGFSKKDE